MHLRHNYDKTDYDKAEATVYLIHVTRSDK